jgi:hypothetical protein
VPRVRDHQQVEVLVRLDQRIDDELRVPRRHVVVQRPMRQQQLSFQVLRLELIRLHGIVVGAVRIPDEQALVPFAPVVLVVALVVVSRLGNADLEEVRVSKHGVGGDEAAA